MPYASGQRNPMTRHDDKIVAVARLMWREGYTGGEIRKFIKTKHGVEIKRSSLYGWLSGANRADVSGLVPADQPRGGRGRILKIHVRKGQGPDALDALADNREPERISRPVRNPKGVRRAP